MISEPSHPKGQAQVVTVREALAGMGAMRDHRLLSARVTAALKFAKPGTGTGPTGMCKALLLASGKQSSGMSLHWIAWDRPSFTIVKQEIADSGSIHPSGERYIHQLEAQRLGSFPDAFRLDCSRKEAFARIGNSVPPLLMRAIALHVRGLLPRRPGEEP